MLRRDFIELCKGNQIGGVGVAEAVLPRGNGLAADTQRFRHKLLRHLAADAVFLQPFEECPEIAEAVARIEKGLEGRGRVLLRYSGTENLCRVMVEGEDADRVRRLARRLADAAEASLR